MATQAAERAMRVALVGPGAIGCAVGALLAAREDIDLEVCARTAFDAFELEGSVDEPINEPARVHTRPETISGPVDLVLLATKVHQTESARGWLDRLCGPDTTVAVLQNGITHLERVTPLVGSAAVVPVVVQMPAGRSAPGRVRLHAPGLLLVPDTPAGQRFAALFPSGPIRARVEADWHTVAWRKLLMNCGVGAITGLARKPNRILADPEAARLCAAVVDEIAAVARADGAKLEPGVGEALVARVSKSTSEHVSSFTADRIAGRPTEWDARNAEVVRRAERHGVDVPLTRALTTLIRLGEPEA